MKIDKEDYNKAVGCLKRYNYNCINIINIRADIMNIASPSMDGLPKAPYNISDSVYNQYIKLQEDKELQKSLFEYKVVVQALQLVSKDSKFIFEQLYQKGKTKWQIVDSGMSEGTYKRRKSDLIYAVHKELKKMSQN